jgi:hypothetical protein
VEIRFDGISGTCGFLLLRIHLEIAHFCDIRGETLVSIKRCFYTHNYPPLFYSSSIIQYVYRIEDACSLATIPFPGFHYFVYLLLLNNYMPESSCK